MLKPYVATAPAWTMPLLILDRFKVHMMASVNNAINNLGLEVIIINPGCTGLIQPANVGYNKQFKNYIHNQEYEDWIMELGCDLTTEKEMGRCILRNSWN